MFILLIFLYQTFCAFAENDNKSILQFPIKIQLNENEIFLNNVSDHFYSEPKSRIVGGTEAFPGEFKGKVSIQNRLGAHFCGGNLIHQLLVLTAAHCVIRDEMIIDANLIQIMGDDLSIVDPPGDNRQIRIGSNIYIHPGNFDESKDLAIIKVSKPFQISETFAPILIGKTVPDDCTNCSVAGWGRTYETDPNLVTNLRRADVQIIPIAICNGSGSYGGTLYPGVLCAGSMDGERDACIGDSGGGLMCNDSLIGIVSMGLGCGRPNFPGIYANAATEYEWINETIVTNCDMCINSQIILIISSIIIRSNI